MVKVAITGGIGSGKSTVLRYLQEVGYPVFSCDEIYKEIIRFPIYIRQIEEIFPECIVGGEIDRARLSAVVFHDEEKRNKLNAIAHPYIINRLTERMSESNAALVFAEVPLLFEGRYESLFDEVIVVMREEASRVETLIRRDCSSKEEIKNKMLAQFPYHSKEAKIRFKACKAILIRNDGSEEELKEQVKEIVKQIS